MKRAIAAVSALAMLWSAGSALAGDRTVALTIDNMTCAACPLIVRASLLEVAGVSGVEVSLETKTAIVTFDDEQADVSALTAATANAGFPSRPAEPR